MKKCFIIGFILLTLTTFATEIDVKGQFADLEKNGMPAGWYFNNWSGYQPLASGNVITENSKNILHIFNTTATDGFGLKSGKQFHCKSGDTINIKFHSKGNGTLMFQLQYFDNSGKWLGIDPKVEKVDLTDEYKKGSVELLVKNLSKGLTSQAILTILGTKNTELFLTELKVNIEEGKVVGDVAFPRHWTVFGKVDPALEPSLVSIPKEIGGVFPQKIVLTNNILDFRPFFNENKLKNCAWAYAVLDAPNSCEYTIGAGADYFMAYYLNGEKILDTLQSGNSGDPHFTNYKVNVKLKKGANLIAVKFLSGSSDFPHLSLGGADDFRNLASVIIVTNDFKRDDYETPAARPGNPKLIKGELTPGIFSLHGQAIYDSGAKIFFPNEKYTLPSKTGDKLFATGIRIQKLKGDSITNINLGEVFSLCLTNQEKSDKVNITFQEKDKVLKSIDIEKVGFPSDVILAVNHNEYFVNIASLSDSKLRTFSGNADFSKLGSFDTSIDFNGQNAKITVDEYFTGLAKCEVKANTVPFKIDYFETFDPVKAAWKLKWSDEFEGREVDWEKKWMSTPWSENTKDRDLAFIKDGKLHIRCEYTDPAKKGRSIGLYSQERFRYGYFEARLRFTKHPGWWAAFWMLDEGKNMVNGGGYELDIFEDYSTRGGKNTIASNLHASRSFQNSYGYHFDLPGSIDDFYVIGCKWTPFEISTYLNGKLIKSTSRHSPWESVTYDAINHGFGTSTLYVCLSGIPGHSGGKTQEAFTEDFIVDYVRVYEYSTDNDPKIKWTGLPARASVNKGETLQFKISAEVSEKTKSPIKTAYLFDNGCLMDYKTVPPYEFNIIIDEKHYKNTAWDRPGRSGKKPVFDRYPHYFVAAVQDADGKVAFTEEYPVIAEQGKGTPFNAKAADIPGTINAADFDNGGHNIANFKVTGTKKIEDGTEDLFSRKGLTLRESGEWISYTVNVKNPGNYQAVLKRRDYRLKWPMKALFLADGKLAGTFNGKPFETEVILDNIKLNAGEQIFTIISACAYGVHPDTIEFKQADKNKSSASKN